MSLLNSLKCCYRETSIAASDYDCSIWLADQESANLSASQGGVGNSSDAKIPARTDFPTASRKSPSWAFADVMCHLSSALAKIARGNHRSSELIADAG